MKDVFSMCVEQIQLLFFLLFSQSHGKISEKKETLPVAMVTGQLSGQRIVGGGSGKSSHLSSLLQ